VSIKDHYLIVMEPGRWYGLKAIGRVVGQAGHVSQCVRLTLERKGWIERTPNPKWDPHAVVTPMAAICGTVREPKWLFRLTPQGEKRRAEAVARQAASVRQAESG
jgi:hypothetical protein